MTLILISMLVNMLQYLQIEINNDYCTYLPIFCLLYNVLTLVLNLILGMAVAAVALVAPVVAVVAVSLVVPVVLLRR